MSREQPDEIDAMLADIDVLQKRLTRLQEARDLEDYLRVLTLLACGALAWRAYKRHVRCRNSNNSHHASAEDLLLVVYGAAAVELVSRAVG